MFHKNTPAHPEVWFCVQRRAQLFSGGFTCINNCVVATGGSSGHQTSPVFSDAPGVNTGRLDLSFLIS